MILTPRKYFGDLSKKLHTHVLIIYTYIYIYLYVNTKVVTSFNRFRSYLVHRLVPGVVQS